MGLLLTAFAVGCGGDSHADDWNTTGPGTSSSSATEDGSGGASTVGTTVGAVTTGGNDSTSSTTGVPVPVCSGVFDEPEWLFSTDHTMPHSFALSPDERELYYVDFPPNEVRMVLRRTRSASNAFFGEQEIVPELRNVCPSVSPELDALSVDLSADGLVAYITCQDKAEPGPGTLVSAKRTRLGASFTPDLTPLATVGMWFSTADGLEAFDNPPGGYDYTLDRYQRESLSVPFGKPEELSLELRGPDPSADGLWLFGSVPVEGSTNLSYQLAAISRPNLSAPFGEPTTEGFPVPGEGTSYLYPEISANCRSIIFLEMTSTVQFSVYEAKR